METDLTKWLIALDTPVEAEAFKTRKEWLETVLIEKGCKLNIGPCGRAKPAKPTKPVQKTQSKKRRGGGTLSTGTNLVKLNKLKMLRDLANRKRLNAIHFAETHNQNPVALGPLKEWHSTPSTPVKGKHGRAMLTATAQPTF
jgi:hypothetical protein